MSKFGTIISACIQFKRHAGQMVASIQQFHFRVLFVLLPVVFLVISIYLISFWDSTSAQSDTDKANLFNKFFHSVFTVDTESATPHASTLPGSSLCSITLFFSSNMYVMLKNICEQRDFPSLVPGFSKQLYVVCVKKVCA